MGREHDEWAEPLCRDCAGRARCARCGGAGELHRLDAVVPCTHCWGDGLCTSCQGTGTGLTA